MTQEFKSKLEELTHAEELVFEPTPGFGKYKPFLNQALAHPAKINMYLLEYLIRKHTKPGDVVLDPMAGSGSLGVVAALHERNAVCVELETKFYEWMEAARRKVEASETLMAKGWIKNIQGDARRLSSLLDEANVIVTSPPYSESMTKKRKGYTVIPELEKTREMPQDTRDDNIANLPHGNIAAIPLGNVDTVITSPPYADSKKGDGNPEDWADRMETFGSTSDSRSERHTLGRLTAIKAMNAGYSKNKDNIGNLPLGNVDTVITSPPYSSGGWKADENPQNPIRREIERKQKFSMRPPDPGRYSDNPNNIGNLPLGNVDAIVTSPPYADTVCDGKEGPLVGGDEKYGRWKEGTAEKHSYREHGEPCKIDTVITSPPYESSLEGTSRHTKGGIASRDLALTQTSTYATRLSFGVPVGYSPSQENIGNLKSSDAEYEAFDATVSFQLGRETYLTAMLRVYEQCFRVLKHGGLAVIVVKPFIRNKAVVDLPLHTWLLMRRVGFRLVKLYKFRLPTESFWRVLYYKRFPDVPKLAHEYVLVTQKGEGSA